EVRETRPSAVGADFDERVMRAVRRSPAPRRPLWSRLVRPRTVTVTPLSWGLMAASLVAVACLTTWHAYADLHPETARPASAPLFGKQTVKAPQRVQFVLVAPTARKVAVVGDFNGWDANHAGYQAIHRGGGVWSVTAPVPVGHH